MRRPKRTQPIDFTKLKKALTDSFRRAFRYIGVDRVVAFDKMGVTKEGLYYRRAEFIGKPCVCGLACGGKTLITIEGSELDHIKPLKGAKTEEDVFRLNKLDNFQWICVQCNLKKSSN